MKKVKKGYKKGVYRKDCGMNFNNNKTRADEDLHYSVGHCEALWKVYKSKGKVKVRIHIADTYDLKKLSKKEARFWNCNSNFTYEYLSRCEV